MNADPTDLPPSRYRFADLTLDVPRRSVARATGPIELKALDFDLLRFLVESAPNVVNADVLAEKVWGRHFVSPENVAQRVMLLRQSLGDDATKPRYIETIRNKGYRLVPEVERAPSPDPRLPEPRPRPIAAWAAAALIAVLAVAGTAWIGLRSSPEPLPAGATSVAVLPFENLSPDPADGYFAAAMQDEIVSQLTKIGGLRVIPIRRVADGDLEVLPDGAAATTLIGSVYTSAGRVRVTPRLTDTATGVAVWSDSYERDLDDIFATQSDIALAVARALRFEVSDSDRQRIERAPTASPRARDLYLRARAREWRDTKTEVLSAIDEIEQALVLDPTFAEAWIAAANMSNVAVYYDPDNAQEHQARGERAAQRAVDLAAEFGEAHAQLGWSLALRKRWKEAEAAYRRARALEFSVGDISSYSILELSVGNFSLARETLEEARAGTPNNPIAHRFLVFANAALGNWSVASELYESGTRVFVPWREGTNIWMHWLVGRGALGEARNLSVDEPLSAQMLARLDAPDDALALLRDALAGSAAGDWTMRRDIGLWAAHFGDEQMALEALRSAIDEQAGQIIFVWLPQVASVRRLPQFKAYLRHIGLVDYWQEYGWPPLCRPLPGDEFECD